MKQDSLATIVFVTLAVLAGCGTLGERGEKAPKNSGYGWLIVTSMPEGIKLFFNGKYIYDDNGNALATPVTTKLEAGTYELSLGLYEYQTWRDTVRVAAGETTNVKVPLIKEFNEANYQRQEHMAMTLGTVLVTVLLVFGVFLRDVQFK